MSRDAATVMRAPAGAAAVPGRWLQRKCACGSNAPAPCPECNKKHPLLRKADGIHDATIPESVQRVLNSTGRPLDADARRDFERGFGHDFSRVRVHDDADAARSARDVHAQAYTVGPHVAFGAGRYSPGTADGRRLLAHELTHVMQQSRSATGAATEAHEREADAMAEAFSSGTVPPSGSAARVHSAPITLHRKPDDEKPGRPDAGAKPDKPPVKAPAAAAPPKVNVTSSTKGAPCACLVVVHNNERNARLTAELMAGNCAYNLAMVEPDNSMRRVKVGTKGELDPNSFFEPDVVKRCLADEKGCRDFVDSKKATTNQKELEKLVQTQFFLAISQCSNRFALPVVALHNNAVNDTQAYMDQKGKKGTTGLKVDIDKRDKAVAKTRLDALKKIFDERFDKFEKVVKVVKPDKTKSSKKVTTSVRKEMMETSGTTNIFRWCESSDLVQCHVGDPDRPDLVTWTTHQADFDRLAKLDVNVVLQNDKPAAAGKESEGDLSTLFVLLKDIFASDLKALLEGLANDDAKVTATLALLAKKRAALKTTDVDSWIQEALLLAEMLEALLTLASNDNRRKLELARTADRTAQLRFVNVETPGESFDKQTNAERVRHYEAIVTVLSALGLHCCGTDPKPAESAVKKGLEK